VYEPDTAAWLATTGAPGWAVAPDIPGITEPAFAIAWAGVSRCTGSTALGWSYIWVCTGWLACGWDDQLSAARSSNEVSEN